MLDLHRLEIFALVARAGSFSAAAERLLMSQSGVSQHMSELEAALGARLFERGRRGVTLTPAGQTLLDYTRQLLRLAAEAELAVTDVASLASGQVAVGATPGVSAYQLPEWVQSFRGRFPRLSVSLKTDITPAIVRGVLAGQLDLGLIEGEVRVGEWDDLGVLVLRDVDQYAVVGRKHAWWDAVEIEMSQLEGQAFIMRQPGSQTRIWLEEALRSHGVRPRIVGEFDHVESIKRAVIAGSCLTILPDYAVTDEVAMGTLRPLPIRGRPLRRDLKLVWNAAGVFSPVTRAFLDHLAGEFPALSSGLRAH